MKGCIGYECFGAGQYVTENLYKGHNWSSHPEKAQEIFHVFIVIYQLFQIGYYLEESKRLINSKELLTNIENLIKETHSLSNDTIANISSIDIESFRNKVNIVFKKVCSAILTNCQKNDNIKIRDFLGRNFKNKNMSGLDLSMKLLIAPNFDNCIFNNTIFLGADTRDTNFNNADLRKAVFLTQGQINAAKGNSNTKLPQHLDYPITWR